MLRALILVEVVVGRALGSEEHHVWRRGERAAVVAGLRKHPRALLAGERMHARLLFAGVEVVAPRLGDDFIADDDGAVAVVRILRPDFFISMSRLRRTFDENQTDNEPTDRPRDINHATVHQKLI